MKNKYAIKKLLSEIGITESSPDYFIAFMDVWSNYKTYFKN